MKITPQLLEKIKQIPLEKFLPDKYRNGRSYRMYLCPFHPDKKPSFAWYMESNTFHCFGCGEHGDNISFIMKLCKVSFPEAIKYLEKHLQL